MKLTVLRIFKGPEYTIGKLYIDGGTYHGEYFCDTLEDAVRIVNNDCSMKIYGKTAIPEGTYKIDFVWWAKHAAHYPHLIDVPCFTGILIHSGNRITDTEGCILVGENKVKGQVINSKTTYNRLMNIIGDQHDLSIQII